MTGENEFGGVVHLVSTCSVEVTVATSFRYVRRWPCYLVTLDEMLPVKSQRPHAKHSLARYFRKLPGSKCHGLQNGVLNADVKPFQVHPTQFQSSLRVLVCDSIRISMPVMFASIPKPLTCACTRLGSSTGYSTEPTGMWHSLGCPLSRGHTSCATSEPYEGPRRGPSAPPRFQKGTSCSSVSLGGSLKGLSFSSACREAFGASTTFCPCPSFAGPRKRTVLATTSVTSCFWPWRSS